MTSIIQADTFEITIKPTNGNEGNYGTPSIRPRIPTRQNVSCIYNGYTLEIYFRQSEGLAEIEIDTSENIYTYEASTASTIIIEVGELPLNTSVSISTSDNNTYYGIIQ